MSVPSATGVIGALKNKVRQPRTLLVHGRKAGAGMDAGQRCRTLARAQVASSLICSYEQGYLAHKNPSPPRTLQ